MKRAGRAAGAARPDRPAPGERAEADDRAAPAARRRRIGAAPPVAPASPRRMGVDPLRMDDIRTSLVPVFRDRDVEALSRASRDMRGLLAEELRLRGP